MKKSLFYTLGVSMFLAVGAHFSAVNVYAAEDVRAVFVEPDTQPAGALSYAEYDYEKTLASALEKGQMVLVEFTGSDWCPPCKRLKKLILNTPEFVEYLKSRNLRFVELDFPRKAGKIAPEQMKKQEAIMNRLRVSGFPSVVLIDGNGLPYKKIVGLEKTPEAYVKHLDAGLELKKNFEKAVADAQAKIGRERAEALANALDLLPPEFRTHRKDIIADIIANDAADEFGFGKKQKSEKLLVEQRKILDAFFKKFGGRFEADEVKETCVEAQKLLESIPDLQPGTALELNKFISDSYALLRDFENALKYLQAAHDADPDSRAGKALVPWIQQMKLIIESQTGANP